MTACLDHAGENPKMTAIRLLRLIPVLLLAVAGCRTEPSPDPRTTIHDFRLPTLTHDRFYLNQHRGKTILIAFWATYCLPCKTELIDMNSLHRTFPKERITVAAVCIDPENINEVKRIAASLKPGYPVLLDHRAALFKSLGLRVTPTTMLIDPGGGIAWVREGYDRQVHKQLTARIQMLVDGGGS